MQNVRHLGERFEVKLELEEMTYTSEEGEVPYSSLFLLLHMPIKRTMIDTRKESICWESPSTLFPTGIHLLLGEEPHEILENKLKLFPDNLLILFARIYEYIIGKYHSGFLIVEAVSQGGTAEICYRISYAIDGVKVDSESHLGSMSTVLERLLRRSGRI